MYKYLLITSTAVLLFVSGHSQVGKSTGIELGFVQGGMTGFSGYNYGGLFSGAIFKEFMARNKRTNMPSIGAEMKLNWSYYSMNNNTTGNSFGMNVYTLPVTFKFNFGSSWTYHREKEDGEWKTYTMFRAIYIYAGPEAGYLTTNASHSGTLNAAFGGVVGGIQVWFNRFKIDIYGHKSITSVYTPGNVSVQGAAIAFGVAF